MPKIDHDSLDTHVLIGAADASLPEASEAQELDLYDPWDPDFIPEEEEEEEDEGLISDILNGLGNGHGQGNANGHGNGNANGHHKLVIGHDGDDDLTGSNDDDTMLGGGGNDHASGGDGNDTLIGDESIDMGQDATPLFLSVENLVSQTYYGDCAQAGDSAIYRDVAFLEDGRSVWGRLVLVGTSDPRMTVDLSGGRGSEILLDGYGYGDTAEFRLEFFDPTTGEELFINSTGTFNDIDQNYREYDVEAVSLDASEYTAFGTSSDTSLNVTTEGGIVRASGTEQNEFYDEDAQFSAQFEGRSFINFTLESRDSPSGFTLSGDLIEDAVYTPIPQGDDTLEGGAGADVIFGEGGNDLLDGGEGDDSIDGGDGDDVMIGGTGSDTMIGGLGGDTMSGGDGDDYIDGGEGDDSLSTGLGNDTLIGGAGNDTLHNSAGDDSLVGGVGDDSIVATEGNDTLEGGDGNDTLYAGVDNDSLDGGTGDDSMFGEDGDDSISGGTGFDYIEGGAGNDTIDGGDDDDTISGGDGDDLIYGGAGDDVLTTGIGNDTLYGGEGNDTLHNSSGDDSLVGGTGNDSITATDGFDTLEGGDGDDTMYGGNDDDLLVGGTGDDQMYGESGADTFVLEDNFGNDTIVGGEAGVDMDVIDMSGLTGPVSVTYTGDEAGFITDGTYTVTFSEIERLTLTDQGDVVDASADSVGVNIDAGAGADTIQGGSGDDSLTGGTGDDQFLLTQSGGADRIADFDLADDDSDGFYNDQIDVSALTGGSGADGAVQTIDVTTSDDGFGNTLLTFPEGEQLVLEGIDPSQMTTHAQLFAAGIPCFTAGALVETARGPRPVEDIRVGDLVQTADNGLQPVVWIGQRELSTQELLRNPHLRPVLLRAGSELGNTRRMWVSPQHRFVLPAELTKACGSDQESFIRARLLADLSPQNARIDESCTPLCYIHLMTEAHQVIFADGCATETYWPGPDALRSLSHRDRQELFSLFPALLRAADLYGTAGRALVQSQYSPLARKDLRRKDLRQDPLVGRGPVLEQRFAGLGNMGSG
ncbi:Hint domain-containing protein [Phaeobacter sp. HF9A]|uniref:Hint domain-containing protein n=1 Tax=Phaeobacter sp. HF9A TaxID=2721561 RepID=UPI00143175BA|nr:Hint domain-containing protein [Phaeobacter sp. HF9A]NIZ15113.1 type I secretion protein [Phaeobacter sp. HF9A]